MKYIKRYLESEIKKKLLNSNKAVVIYGPRQAGKTTLANKIIKNLDLKTIKANADQQEHFDVLSSKSLRLLKSLMSGSELLFIDEAQRIPNIGLSLKILVDEMPKLKILATGSSSFELSNKISEPLTGRTWTYHLYPISINELKNLYNPLEINSRLEELLIFGSYPEIFYYDSYTEKQSYLLEVARSYLFKDIFDLAEVKYSQKVRKLLKLLAFQIGAEVSINELATQLGLGRATIERYLDLLEKAYLIFSISGFSRNLRKEVSKMDKIYFYDLGVRNAIIENFNSLDVRNDKGALWENFLMVERKKFLANRQKTFNQYFWRLYTGAELAYVEERSAKIKGYEFKFSKTKPRPPESWKKTYPQADYSWINKENYWEFLKAKV